MTTDLSRNIKDILKHTDPLPDDARSPILHYRRTGAEIWGSLAFIEEAVNRGGLIRAIADRHLGRFYGMALVTLIETLERFLKETAAECVDCLAPFVVDDRFNVFNIQGSTLASHFEAGTLGRALCESSTWLDGEEINKRFRKLLADPYQVGGKSFHLFPKPNQVPEGSPSWFELMDLVWQIRHTSVHNVGVITQSDAVKLGLLAREKVESPRLLAPTQADLLHLKQFLDERADECNRRIGERLADLLTTIHESSPTLFDPKETADRVAELFQQPSEVAGAVGVVPD